MPSNGELTALRAVLDRVDREQLSPLALTVHASDLDDVFFALTGQHGTAEISPESRIRRLVLGTIPL